MRNTCARVADAKVSVNVTPQGRADSIIHNAKANAVTTSNFKVSDQNLDELVFAYPAEVKMTLRDLFTRLGRKHDEVQDLDLAVYYLSQQDDNLRKQFPSVLMDQDVKGFAALASTALNTQEPEAVNLWIGDQNSVSSCHKDHFENLYAVIQGEKLLLCSSFDYLTSKWSVFVPADMYIMMRMVEKI